MYEYVSREEVMPYKIISCDLLNRLKMSLQKNQELETQVELIGSGAKNLITRNGRSSFDLDYNLVIYENIRNINTMGIKQIIMNEIDSLSEGTWFAPSKDSTSAITLNIPSTNAYHKSFSIDIAILALNNYGDLCKLVHNKRVYNKYQEELEQVTWVELRNSSNIREKAELLKKNNLWQEVRRNYLEKKNSYLSAQDPNHPSFVVYIETINEIYYKNGGQ